MPVRLATDSVHPISPFRGQIEVIIVLATFSLPIIPPLVVTFVITALLVILPFKRVRRQRDEEREDMIHHEIFRQNKLE